LPAAGPLLVVANHPFGAADGVALLALIRRVRRDVRLVGNSQLRRIPELQPLVFAVDLSGGRDARVANQATLRRAIDWTKRGGALIVFPAGEVSNLPGPGGTLIDGPWRRGAARIVVDSGAAVVPVFFEGRNSRGFGWAGRVHPGLRTALLPRELLRMRGRSIAPVVGRPIPSARLAEMADPATLVDYLRARTYGLSRRAPSPPPSSRLIPALAPAEPADALEREVLALGPDRRLQALRSLSVHYASAEEIPAVLREIGRLRELTFRAVGEGSGRALDLDEFDDRYLHLFVWDRAARVVVGAYRLGPTDVVASRLGPRGLYTRTLFTYGRAFLRELGPALELGRSFVRAEYQRDYGALLLLWQGIGRFVSRHPRYQRLFGPVSISGAYSAASRDLLSSMLADPSRRSPLASLVAPRRPYPLHTTPTSSTLAAHQATVHRTIGEIERDGAGVPVLVRQYLKLNAEVLSVSVDPGFSNVIDALMVVDVRQVPPGLRERYLINS
jgi:putative hemolysin